MTLIFSGSLCTPALSMMYPQKGTGPWKKVDLSMQGNRWCQRSSSCTKSRCCWCSSASLEKTRMLSMHTHTKIPKWSQIHDALEGRRCVTEAKGQNNRFEGAQLCVEGGFLDIFVVDSDLVEPADKVYLRKYGGTPQCTQEGLDRR